jgi:hypothetical protein
VVSGMLWVEMRCICLYRSAEQYRTKNINLVTLTVWVVMSSLDLSSRRVLIDDNQVHV